MSTINHFHVPERMARVSGNRPACCARPESEHPTFAVGTTAVVELTKPVRSLKGRTFPKGTRLEALLETLPTIRIVSEGRWGWNPDGSGRMMELERSVVEDVRIPSFSVNLPGDLWRTAIPVTSAKVVA